MIKKVSFLLFLSIIVGCSFTLPHRTRTSDVSYEHEALLAWEKVGRSYESGKYDEALKGYQEFLQKYPYSQWNEMAYYFIAQCHHKMKQVDQALQAYRQVIEKYPASVWADLARERIQEIVK